MNGKSRYDGNKVDRGEPFGMVDADSPLALACAYTEDDSGGIISYRWNQSDGTLHEVARMPAPATTYGAAHPAGTHVYTTNRVDGGVVTAYRLDNETGALTTVNRQSSEGVGPCFVSVDATGRYAFVANYTAGTVAMLPIEADGRLGEATDDVEHDGSSVDPDRQEGPHPHAIVPGPENRFVYVPDLGTDRIAIYRIDFENGTLRPADPPYTPVHEGAGPRHLDFHPTERYAYVIHELDSAITAFEYDPETGALDEIGTVETLPHDAEGENFCADVHVHPSGAWVYGSNRGHDSIAIFEVNPESGRLRAVGHESTCGHWPRDFALDPSGRFLYAENRRSDSLVSFAVDAATGELRATGQRLSLPEPLCLQFVPSQ